MKKQQNKQIVKSAELVDFLTNHIINTLKNECIEKKYNERDTKQVIKFQLPLLLKAYIDYLNDDEKGKKDRMRSIHYNKFDRYLSKDVSKFLNSLVIVEQEEEIIEVVEEIEVVDKKTITKKYEQLPNLNTQAINILSYLSACKFAPRLAQIANYLEVNPTTIKYHLLTLRDKGYIRCDDFCWSVTNTGFIALYEIFGSYKIENQKAKI